MSGRSGSGMKTRSRALEEWRRSARKSWRRSHARQKSVVHFVRMDDSPVFSGGGFSAWRHGHGFRRFVILALVLLGCVAWLTALIGRLK